MNYPLKKLNKMTHIGMLNEAQKGIQGSSQEGMGISFSNCPDVWESIVKIGNLPWWRLNLESGKWLDGYKMQERYENEVNEWGLLNGYVEEKTVFKFTYFDSEMDEECYILLSTLEDACLESSIGVEEYLEDPSSFPEIIKQNQYSASPKLLEEMGWNPGIEQHAMTFQFLAQQWAKEHDFDGIWWAHKLDQYKLSAPCGVIFPEKIEKFERTLVRSPKPLEFSFRTGLTHP